MDIKKEWLGKQLTLQNLLLILILIIFIVPRLLTINTGIEWLDFRKTGQIGDTIGGLTGPFINAISAILVYIAFKEQVLANVIIKNQQNYQFIQEQLNRLEDSVHKVDKGSLKLKSKILASLHQNEQDGIPEKLNGNKMNINKLIYIADLFLETNRQINEIKEADMKSYFSYKIQLLYRIIYQHYYLGLADTLRQITGKPEFTQFTNDFLSHVDMLEAAFAEKNEHTGSANV